MPKKMVGAVARVVVTIEVPCSSTWGDDCTVNQIHEQAMDEMRRRISVLCLPGAALAHSTIIDLKARAVISERAS